MIDKGFNNDNFSAAPSGQLDFLTVDEASAYLRVNRNTIYEAIKHREFPSVKIGRVIRIPRVGFIAWASGNNKSARVVGARDGQ